MLPLRELQLRFAAALFDDVTQPVLPWICADGIEAEARVGIYRNNLREGFIKTLALEFAVIQRLVGEGYFRHLALLFLADHPSRAGNLHHIGQPFPTFLQRRFAGTEYGYLPGVAALEWAQQECSIASDAPAFDPTCLQSVAPERLAGIGFEFHPACRLVSSEYPIVRIWSANQPDADPDEQVDLAGGPDYVLVRRSADGVEFRRLPRAQFTFVQALMAGSALGDALDEAHSTDRDFNLAEVLPRLVTLCTVTAIRFKPHPGVPA